MKRAEFLKHLAIHNSQLLREGANHTIYTDAIPFCERPHLVQHGITQSKQK